ncbi:hypothetical protein [Plebeiibacterium marinum]|uniref:START domain-containing protein n=1 Tax=Plebeiibacterium marinum TaxID=2992111 RepID=A0AAE3MEZ6_9BACT|nr:hypothetical protein [Plebeiobacterium marinum]MCW3805847.1 hypothetical protein [Plebeiobacterium marinum]
MIIVLYILLRVFYPGSLFFVRYESLFKTHSEEEWICVKATKGVTLHERWVSVNDSLSVRERKGEFVATCNITKVQNFLSSHLTVDKWMKNIRVTEFNRGGSSLFHFLIDLPWPFNNRDFIGKYSVYNLDQNNSIIKIESVDYAMDKVTGVVRMKSYRATWELIKINDSRTKIVFTTFSEEPPMFPQWIQEPVIKKVFMGNLVRLKELLSGKIG